jgi:excisionase family DNA binding protein
MKDGVAERGMRLMSPKQIAELSGFHEEVIRRAIRRGEIPASTLCGRLRVRLEDYQAWVEGNRMVVA